VVGFAFVKCFVFPKMLCVVRNLVYQPSPLLVKSIHEYKRLRTIRVVHIETG